MTNKNPASAEHDASATLRPLPYASPSEELFTLLDWLNAAHADLQRCTHFEFQHTELRTLGELTSLQVDRLLSPHDRS